MRIKVPETSLIVLIGPSGAGKTTFAQRCFLPTEILSSDRFRALVANDERDQSASKDAFSLLYTTLEKRLQRNLLTVVDATSLQSEARQALLGMAKKYQVPTVAILFDLPEAAFFAQNRARGYKALPTGVIKRHISQLRVVKRQIKREKFRYQYVFRSSDEIQQARVYRHALPVDRRLARGPFDLIGDVHGCFPELLELLNKLGYQVQTSKDEERTHYRISHPDGRKLVFVGDLVDRGPDNPGVLDFVRDVVKQGVAFAVCGNHDQKFIRYLQGKKVEMSHGIDQTIAQSASRSKQWHQEVLQFLRSLPSHYLFDRGNLVVAHAGLPEDLQGRSGGRVRNVAIYGEKTGEVDAFGVPIRKIWAEEYQGQALVVFGHTPVEKAVFYHNTVDIDTGCVFGGKLTALRYPEKTFLSVPAKEKYAEFRRPFLKPDEIAPGYDEGLSVQPFLQSQPIETRFLSAIHLSEEQRLSAFEEMNRFAVDPRWLIYLPPTMSPSETAASEDYLEHPQDAFAYYQQRGITKVICEEKHMGSRAIVVICRDPEVAVKRFALDEPSYGIIYTRAGRRFFSNLTWEQELLKRLANAMERSDFWTDMKTDWACLDAECLPWSAKAQQLLRKQYAAVGTASKHALSDTLAALQQAEAQGRAVEELVLQFKEKQQQSFQFRKAYRHYCWPVEKLEDYKLAPFHLLATEGKVYHDQSHEWHLAQVSRFCREDPQILLTTQAKVIDLEDEASVEKGVSWWLEITAQGGEGMVVKPLYFLTNTERGLIQPAIKCRGREYLRIIYGPDYTSPQQLKRLRNRGLKRKRSLAMREYALGLEALERFVAHEPLQRVHECCFAIMALETEPLDPRL